MNIEFIYMKELEALLQIMVLGAVLSLPVCYAVECLKSSGITKKWFYFLAGIVTSVLFGLGFAQAFTDMTKAESIWLCLALWLGSQGFYDKLKESEGFLGKSFTSLSKRLQLEDEKTEKEEINDEENTADNASPDTPEVKEEVKEEVPVVPDDEETDEPLPLMPISEKRNVAKNQIKILVNDLRVRATPNGTVLGYADKNGYYSYSETVTKEGITWYNVGDCYIGDSGSGDLAVCKTDDYMIFPLKQFVGVSTKFSDSHPAVDFGWNRNYGGSTQTIIAPYDMKVVKEGFDSTVGNYIYAQATYEGKKYTFRFIHLSTTNVNKGDTVKRGTVIGKMGNTGSSSSGAHLHFDILDGHRTSLPSNRYANSYDAMKLCYATANVVVGNDTLKEFSVLKV